MPTIRKCLFWNGKYVKIRNATRNFEDLAMLTQNLGQSTSKEEVSEIRVKSTNLAKTLFLVRRVATSSLPPVARMKIALYNHTDERPCLCQKAFNCGGNFHKLLYKWIYSFFFLKILCKKILILKLSNINPCYKFTLPTE